MRLTEASYIVLGLLERVGPATPYELKQIAQLSTANFWSVPHTQLYTECARLTAAGLLTEERELTGRRRRVYTLTEAGLAAFDAWRGEPRNGLYQLRDTGTLKLFFGADPNALARSQIELHTRQLELYEELAVRIADSPEGWRMALEAGMGHEREFVRFWTELLESGPGGERGLGGGDGRRAAGEAGED